MNCVICCVLCELLCVVCCVSCFVAVSNAKADMGKVKNNKRKRARLSKDEVWFIVNYLH